MTDNHQGFTSPRLSHMREVLTDVQMSDGDRQTVESAIGEVESHWKEQHRDAYDSAVATRDYQHEEVMSGAHDLRSRVDEAMDAVKSGRMTPDEARKQTRDMMAEFQRMTDHHHGVVEAEQHLDNFSRMTPDDYQAQMLDRFPSLQNSSPTLQKQIDDHLAVRPNRRKASNLRPRRTYG